MSKKEINKNTAAVNEENAAPKKTLTKYDQKMQRRAQEAVNEKKSKKKETAAAVLIAVVVAAVIGLTAYNSIADRYATYVTIGDHEIKKAEFDYYYNVSYQNFLGYYGSMTSLIGLDTSAPLSSQAYTEDMTWDDMFDEQAVETLKTVYGLVDAAEEAGFEYDTTEDVENIISSLQSAAETAGMSESEYLTSTYGKLMTMEKARTYIANSCLSSAYETHLLETQEVTEDEINAYYEEKKDSYDSIDYKLLRVATQEEADTILSKITDEASFDELFEEYDNQEEAESTYLGITKSALGHTSAVDWLFDQSRQAGDKTVIEVSTGENYYVIYFMDRYLADTVNEDGVAEWHAHIEETLKNDAIAAYKTELASEYTVTDNRGKLDYLKIEPKEETTEAAE